MTSLRTTRLVVGTLVVLAGATVAGPARAIDLSRLAGKAAGSAASGKVEKEVNSRLLAEGRKNQCNFKTDSDQLMAGCDAKLKKLANVLIEAKKQLNGAGVQNFKFEVSGHTDSSGRPDHNKELSGKRAAVIERELVARGIAKNEIMSIGLAAERPLVKPDNTPAKKARNRRYEIQVRF